MLILQIIVLLVEEIEPEIQFVIALQKHTMMKPVKTVNHVYIIVKIVLVLNQDNAKFVKEQIDKDLKMIVNV